MQNITICGSYTITMNRKVIMYCFQIVLIWPSYIRFEQPRIFPIFEAIFSTSNFLLNLKSFFFQIFENIICMYVASTYVITYCHL